MDWLIELPNGVLCTIISLLTVKEAVRTSVLSKRWRSVWTFHSDLCFDSSNILGIKDHIIDTSSGKFDLDGQAQRYKFVERVHHFMNNRCQGLNINSLTIHYHLGKEFSSHIDQWVSVAVMKGVQSIDFDLSEWCSFKGELTSSTAVEHYELHFQLLIAPGRKSTLKHLRLSSCTFNVPLSFNNLSSLITIKLQHVCVSDQGLKSLLSNCLFLEELSLHVCENVVNLNIAGPSIWLKFLSIQHCGRLRTVEISAENLLTFEYAGSLTSFSFKNVPKLVQALVTFTGSGRLKGVTYALTRLTSDLPRLEKLNLISILSMKALVLPANWPPFTNLNQLLLSICPFDDEDRLTWITYILNAFPLLQKLQLNLFSPSFLRQPMEMLDRLLPKCPHRHLTEAEINGFCGNQHEVELLKYLLDNLVALEVLIIGPCQKIYKGFNDWVFDEANSWCSGKLECIYEWIHKAVSPNVHLEVR